jgi:predicted transposase/invertase (TIGR01784 family)
MKAKYINPYTDFGFKKLFGEEGSKELLKDFLNELLPPEHKIQSLSLKPTERLPNSFTERKAIFDIHCVSESGSRFIVEMQKAKHNFFKDRAVFYSTFPIQEQAEKGEWNFQLKPVYCVALLDFTFDKEKSETEYLSNIQLKNQYCEVFYDKLTFLFIEMPRFTKTEKELTTHFDKWLYFLKHLEDFTEIPEILNEQIFIEGFHKAELASYNESEKYLYEENLKVYRDMFSIMETATHDSYMEGTLKGIMEGTIKGIMVGKIEGKIEGKMEAKLEVVKNGIKQGLSNEIISQLTGISIEEIEKMKLSFPKGVG